METKLPPSTIAVQDIRKEELPDSSYRWSTAQFGKFIPFVTLGNEALWSSDQLNWTNLYLINKFGEYRQISTEDAKILNEINEIRILNMTNKERLAQLGQQLSREFTEVKLLINQTQTLEDLQKVQKLVNNQIGDNKSLLGHIKDIENKIDQIAERLGIGLPAKPAPLGETIVETKETENLLMLRVENTSQNQDNIIREFLALAKQHK